MGRVDLRSEAVIANAGRWSKVVGGGWRQASGLARAIAASRSFRA